MANTNEFFPCQTSAGGCIFDGIWEEGDEERFANFIADNNLILTRIRHNVYSYRSGGSPVMSYVSQCNSYPEDPGEPSLAEADAYVRANYPYGHTHNMVFSGTSFAAKLTNFRIIAPGDEEACESFTGTTFTRQADCRSGYSECPPYGTRCYIQYRINWFYVNDVYEYSHCNPIPDCPEGEHRTNGVCCKIGYTWDIVKSLCIEDCPNQHPFPEKDNDKYSYSDEWEAGEGNVFASNDQYCINGGGEVETSIEIEGTECVEKHRCKIPDDCIERDKPFPPEDTPSGYDTCTYSTPWSAEADNADELDFNCQMEAMDGNGLVGWVKLADGTCHDVWRWKTSSIETARIECIDYHRCKTCTKESIDNSSNPLIPCGPDVPINSGGGGIYVPPPPGPAEPWDPGHDYPYRPPDFPRYPDLPPFTGFPPYDPEQPGPPIPWNPWPPYDPDSQDFNTFEWCDCDIKDTVSNNCGCFEKPVQNSGLSCSGYFPKTYKRWAASFCYNNSEDTL